MPVIILASPAGALTAAGLHLTRIHRQDRDYEHGLYQAADRARALHPRLCRILRYR